MLLFYRARFFLLSEFQSLYTNKPWGGPVFCRFGRFLLKPVIYKTIQALSLVYPAGHPLNNSLALGQTTFELVTLYLIRPPSEVIDYILINLPSLSSLLLLLFSKNYNLQFICFLGKS